jgi:hypothetical protein
MKKILDIIEDYDIISDLILVDKQTKKKNKQLTNILQEALKANPVIAQQLREKIAKKMSEIFTCQQNS